MGSTSSILPFTDSSANTDINRNANEGFSIFSGEHLCSKENSNNIEDNPLYKNKFIVNDTKVYDKDTNKELNIDDIKKNIENDPCLAIYIRYKEPLAYEYWKNQLKIKNEK